MMSSVVGHEEAKAAAAAAAEGNEGGLQLQVPNDLIVEILSKIPASSLFRLRQVCKHWFNLISSDSSFINMNLHHSMKHHPYILMKGIHNKHIHHRSSDYLITFYSLNCCWSLSKNPNIINHAVLSVLPTLEQSYVGSLILFVGHCNGLLCMRTPRSNFCVWNPCTKEFKELPNPVTIYPPGCDETHHAYGFGYDYTINDYKLIATEGLISYTGDDAYHHVKNRYTGDDDDIYDGQVITRVCTLGAGAGGRTKSKKKKKWKIVKRRDSPAYMFRIASMLRDDSCGFFFNGGLYWMEKPVYGIESVIICFDISKEEYKEISIPQCKDDNYWFMKFDEFKGSLCILKHHMHFREHFIEGWMMKDDDYSWTKLFTINGSLTGVAPSVCKIAIKTSISNDNGEIIIVEVGSDDSMSMLWYNPEYPSNSGTSTKEFGIIPAVGTMYTCTESLVSLNSGTYFGKTEEEAKKKQSLVSDTYIGRKEEEAKKKQSLVSLNSGTYIGRSKEEAKPCVFKFRNLYWQKQRRRAKKKQRRRRRRRSNNEETTKEENNNSNKKRKVSY